jgi:hypothetical protein
MNIIIKVKVEKQVLMIIVNLKPRFHPLVKEQSQKVIVIKKQILRDSVFINEKVKNTIKNNIGKLDDIDPDNGYKELMDSVEYSNYLSEAIDNADDFSENSQFGEDADSSISLGDISDRMKKSANTLKNNVETAVSQDMLSTSRKRTIRHSTKQKGNNSGKSISKVVNASSKKEKTD